MGSRSGVAVQSCGLHLFMAAGDSGSLCLWLRGLRAARYSQLLSNGWVRVYRQRRSRLPLELHPQKPRLSTGHERSQAHLRGVLPEVLLQFRANDR